MSGERADQLAAVALAVVGILALPVFLWRERQARKAEAAEAWRAVFRGDDRYGLPNGHGLDATMRWEGSE